MAKQIPFVVHVKVFPARGETKNAKVRQHGRWTQIRDLQKLSYLAYEQLAQNANITIATPGGGQHQSAPGISKGGMSGLIGGSGIKLQIGDNPAQLQFTGFYANNTENVQPHPDSQLIAGGETLTGARNRPWEANPNAAVSSEVSALKTLFENDLTTAFPSNTPFSIFRIELYGIIFGDRGYHFPV